jgi:hypothetical protein
VEFLLFLAASAPSYSLTYFHIPLHILPAPPPMMRFIL